MIEAEAYALALITEECGEVLQLVGKAGRFGIDTPGVKDALTGEVDMEKTPRAMLERECGDLFAAIDYAIARKVLDGATINRAHSAKLRKLLDPASTDNLGRRLAP